jgi:general secretion pathway protein G
MLRGRYGRSAGFTLLEVVVTVAILGMLAAVLTPQVVSRMNNGASATLLSTLTGLQEAATAHRGDVGRYPQTLRQLSTEPTSGVRDSCGRLIPGFAFELWTGPYVDRSIAATGIDIGGSVIAATLRRSPTTYSDAGTLYIDVAGVDKDVADQMEQSMDGTIDYAAGSILWAQVGTTGRGTLSLASPVRGC